MQENLRRSLLCVIVVLSVVPPQGICRLIVSYGGLTTFLLNKYEGSLRSMAR